MLSAPALATCNHLLGQHPWARKRLSAHAGAVAELTFGDILIRFSVNHEVYLTHVAEANQSDVSITIPADALTKLPRGIDALMSHVRIGGNADFADSLSFVFRHLRWDREADLARLVGPIAGRRAHLAIDHASRSLPALVERSARNIGEFLVHEGGVLVAPGEVDALGDALRHLRDDMARLEKRLDRVDKLIDAPT